MQNTQPQLVNSAVIFQHDHLHDQIDAINQAIRNHVDHDDLLELLQETLDFMAFHFLTEDQIMRELDYPKQKLEEHREAHAKALNKLRELLSDFSHNNSSPKRISEFISYWTYLHEVTVDQELSLFTDDILRLEKTH